MSEGETIIISDIDSSFGPSELDLVSELFHRINRIIPENQRLVSVPPEMPASEAIKLLEDKNYSQVPVVINGYVIGVFSYRSFAAKAALSTWEDISKQKTAPRDLAVEEFIEQFEFVRVTQEMRQVFTAMDKDNGILIGSPETPQGILTPMDMLKYLYEVTSPFVLISEIELALRALIRYAVTQEELEICATRSLAKQYNGEDNIPKNLEEMSFNNYLTIIANGDNWPKFEPVLGGNRVRTRAKLEQIRDLRNDIFHFKRELTLDDHGTLTDHRDWLLMQTKKADIRRASGKRK
jgi:predicted transcriptional regulator